MFDTDSLLSDAGETSVDAGGAGGDAGGGQDDAGQPDAGQPSPDAAEPPDDSGCGTVGADCEGNEFLECTASGTCAECGAQGQACCATGRQCQNLGLTCLLGLQCGIL